MWWDERSKIARSCVAKLTLKSKRQKHLMFGALLKVEMFKKCAPLLARTFGTLLEVGMSKKCTPLWREDAPSTF